VLPESEVAGEDAGGDEAGADEAGGGEDAGADEAGGEDAGGGDDAGGGEEAGGGEDAGGEDAGGEDAGCEDAGGDEDGGEDAGCEDAGADDGGGWPGPEDPVDPPDDGVMIGVGGKDVLVKPDAAGLRYALGETGTDVVGDAGDDTPGLADAPEAEAGTGAASALACGWR